MRRLALLASALALLAACAAERPRTAGPDPALLRDIIANAAMQVKRCYQRPRGLSRAARQITIVLGVHYNPDGSLAEPPVVVSQSGVTPRAAFDAVQLGQAAIGAAQRCSPLGLPPQLYANGWDRFELTFSFGAIG